MYLDQFPALRFKPAPTIVPPYFPKEQIEFCKRAVRKFLKHLRARELRALIRRLMRGEINGWMVEKSPLTYIATERQGKHTADQIAEEIFGRNFATKVVRNYLSSEVVVTASPYDAFKYWFYQIIGSVKPCLHSNYCTPKNCFFTQLTIEWCKTTLKGLAKKRKK